MGFAYDVCTEVEKASPQEATILLKGQMPSCFSWGDRFHSNKVDLFGMKLAVLVYPKGSKKSSNSSVQVFLRNYSLLPKMFDTVVWFRGQDKKIKNLILGPKRCVFVGDFEPIPEPEGHSPYVLGGYRLK